MASETRTIGFQDCETAIALPKDAIADFCDRWKIDELYLFGSILRDDFHSDSDVDVLVTFSPDSHWGWEIVSMKDELEEIFHRKVDFLTKKSIEDSKNWIRQKEILSTARLFYAA
ncbi:MAG: nucleotidyltransferase domain-containing protein [Cyanobacteria bacterium J06621_11]